MAGTSSEESKEKNPERDSWSKAQILLAPVGGLLTALAVACVGIYGSAFLNRKQELDTRARVYAELITQREQAESALRKDMFVSIIDPSEAGKRFIRRQGPQHGIARLQFP